MNANERESSAEAQRRPNDRPRLRDANGLAQLATCLVEAGHDAEVLDRNDLETMDRLTPRALRQLVRRCLERDPKRRLRDIGEARLALEELLAGRGDDEVALVAPAIPREPLSGDAPLSRNPDHASL